MILLEVNNRVIQETLTANIKIAQNGGRLEILDIMFVDFDGVIFHISSFNGNKYKIRVSMLMKTFDKLRQHGLSTVLTREYENLLIQPERGFNISLLIDLNSIPQDWEATVEKISLLKRNCFAVVFEKYFDIQEKLVNDKVVHKAVIGHRKGEYFSIEAKSDRVVVVVSTVFKEFDDLAIGKVFMKEFREGRNTSCNAPQVFFTQNSVDDGLDNYIGYVTFILLPRHITKDARDNTINLIHMFRQYLRYHIKCSKAFIHSKIRSKTNDLLKVLDRAVPKSRKSKRTIAVKTKMFVIKE